MTNIRTGCSCCCFAEEFIIARKQMKQRKMKQKEGEETGEWLQNLIQVMTYQELCQRRREKQKYETEILLKIERNKKNKGA